MSAVPDPNSDDGLFGNIKDIFGGLNDLTGGNLGNLAAGAAGINAASQQKKENTALVQPLKDTATPYLSSGLDQLGSYQQLTPLQQQALNAGTSTGATLTSEADPLLGIGRDAFAQYQAGTLPAWQQAALDKKIATAKALNKQALGANVDSSSLGATESNIDTQGLIAQGQLLQANLATGQGAYKQGTDLQAQGGNFTKASYDKAVSDVNQNLQNAINTTLTGLGPLQSAIQIEIAGNTALTGQLQALFAALAKSLSAGSSSGTNGLSSIVSGLKGLGGAASSVKNLFGNTPDSAGIVAGGQAASDAARDQLSSDLSGDNTLDLGSDFLGAGAGLGALGSSAVPAGAVEGLFGPGGELATTFGSGATAGTGAAVGAGSTAAGAAELGSDLGAGLGSELGFGAGLSPDAALAGSLAPVESAAPAAAAPEASGLSSFANVAVPAAAAAYTAYGIIRSLTSPGMNNFEGQLNTQTGQVQLTAMPGGRGGMPLAQQGVTLADANAYYAPVLQAYAKTGSVDAARAALPVPRNGKEQAMYRFFDQLHVGSDSIFNSIDQAMGR